MILWINGAFGVGKTQTTFALYRRVPDAYVYDPERVGDWLQRNLPPQLSPPDFQDCPLWRSMNRDLLCYLAQRQTGLLLVPMTVTNPSYWQELTEGLQDRFDLRHVILTAGRRTIHRRLRKRLEGRNAWAARQTDRCLAAFAGDMHGVPIDTEGRTVDQVAELVAAACGISLSPDVRSRPRRWCDRALTQLRHIR